MRITGAVQGVGFRYLVQRRARSLGVAGWVRNEQAGMVAAAFEGPRDLVESMVDWCRRGPAGARVDGIEVVWLEPADASDFEIRW